MSDEPGDAHAGTKVVVPVAEERLRVGLEESVRVAARIGVQTHEEVVEIAAPLRRTWTEIVRTPCNIVTAKPPVEWREADGTRVIPVVEEILVRRYRVVEEIRLVERSETHELRESVTLRRQEVSITETPGNPPLPKKA